MRPALTPPRRDQRIRRYPKRDQGFESCSLQRRVCKLSVPVALSGITSRGRHTARKIEHMPVEMPTSTTMSHLLSQRDPERNDRNCDNLIPPPLNPMLVIVLHRPVRERILR